MITDVLNADLTYRVGEILELSDLGGLKHITNENQVIQCLQSQLQTKKLVLETLRKTKLLNYISPKLHLIRQFPILPFQPHFLGATSYLDGIKARDMTHPVMFGVDPYRRVYICVKYRCCQDSFRQNNEEVQIDPTGRIFTLTVFQRYTESRSTLCKAGSAADCYQNPYLNGTRTRLSQQEISLFLKNIFILLERQELEYQYWGETERDHSIKKVKCQLVF